MATTSNSRRVNMERLIEANYYMWRSKDLVFAIRHCQPVADGAELEPSRVWVDGDPTDELCDGTCALDLHEWRMHADYSAQGPCYLVVGRPLPNSVCEDIGEMQLADCRVVCEIEPY
jgi:hypothetical protein